MATLLASGASGTATIVDFQPSPDGKLAAIQILDNQKKEEGILIMPIEGGTANRAIWLTTRGGREIPAFDWMPDSTTLLISRRNQTDWQMCEVQRIPIDGSPAQPAAIRMHNIRFLRVSPDGRQIAFQAGEYKAETWALENVLPPSRTVARR